MWMPSVRVPHSVIERVRLRHGRDVLHPGVTFEQRQDVQQPREGRDVVRHREDHPLEPDSRPLRRVDADRCYESRRVDRRWRK
jgi:hypothetical protein